MDRDIPLVMDSGDEFVHPVEIAKQGRFSAARRPDKGGYFTRGNLHVDTVESLLLTVEELKVIDLDKVAFAWSKIIG